jgi:hypothetical protein
VALKFVLDNVKYLENKKIEGSKSLKHTYTLLQNYKPDVKVKE